MKELSLELRISGKEIQVKAKLPVSSGRLEFCLGAGLQIDGLTWDGKPVSYHFGEPEEHRFAGWIRHVSAEGPVKEGSIAEASYHGRVSGSLNCVEEDKIALSFYSAWFPIDCSEHFERSCVSCYGMEDFMVLRGR